MYPTTEVRNKGFIVAVVENISKDFIMMQSSIQGEEYEHQNVNEHRRW